MDLFLPKIAYASVDTFVSNMNRLIINPLIYLLFGLAILFFLYGMLQFLLNQSNEEKKTQGKQHMIWGILGIVIMMGVWTILGIIAKTLGVSETNINNSIGR